VQQLSGQVVDVQYDVQGAVVKKYAPKYGQRDFFVQLEAGQKLYVNEHHYATFDVGDVIGTDASGRGGGWVRVYQDTELVVLHKAVPEVREVQVRLEYVSEPKKIGSDYWYLANVDDTWYRIPYSVAARYWLGDRQSVNPAMQGSYYDLLGVSRQASVEEIQAAWRRLVRQNHPDLYPLVQRDYQGQVTARLNVARDTLCDRDERQRYDRQLLDSSDRSDVDDAEVRAWPGRGFGTLRCEVEVRGDSFLVTRIVSWANEEVRARGSIRANQLLFERDGSVIFEVPIGDSVYSVSERIRLEPEFLPFRGPFPYYQDRSLPGIIKYDLLCIRTGRWDWQNERVVKGLRVREANIEWPEEFLRAIQRR